MGQQLHFGYIAFYLAIRKLGVYCSLQDPEFWDERQHLSPTASNYPAIAPPSSNASV